MLQFRGNHAGRHVVLAVRLYHHQLATVSATDRMFRSNMTLKRRASFSLSSHQHRLKKARSTESRVKLTSCIIPPLFAKSARWRRICNNVCLATPILHRQVSRSTPQSAAVCVQRIQSRATTYRNFHVSANRKAHQVLATNKAGKAFYRRVCWHFRDSNRIYHPALQALAEDRKGG